MNIGNHLLLVAENTSYSWQKLMKYIYGYHTATVVHYKLACYNFLNKLSEIKSTCSLSGDWMILERRLAFSWTLCTRANSALEIFAKGKTKKE